MKRKREVDKESEMMSATSELCKLAKFKAVDQAASHIPTKPFLSLCNWILQFLGTCFFSVFFSVAVLRTVER